MKTRKRARLVFWILLLILVLIQFIPVDRSFPAINPGEDFVTATSMPVESGQLLKNACYDCHSYETEYPWYFYIAPVSLWLQGHIRNGRGQVNFSTWQQYSAEDKEHVLEECVEVMEKKSMPLKSFTWTHPEARLTDADRETLRVWFDGLR